MRKQFLIKDLELIKFFINSGTAIKSLLRRVNIGSLRKLPKIRRGNPAEIITTLVWSPVASGKTFLSANLAAAAAQLGLTVALMDLDLDCAAWFGISEEDGLDRASGNCGNPWIYSYNPEMLDTLGIFTSTSGKPVKVKMEFLRNLEADLVIVNSKKLVSASNIIIVADMDMAHVRKISEIFEYEKIANSPSEKWLVINRAVKGMSINIEYKLSGKA